MSVAAVLDREAAGSTAASDADSHERFGASAEFCDGCNGACGRLLDFGLGTSERVLRLPPPGRSLARGTLIAAQMPYSMFSLLTACVYLPALAGLLLGVAIAPSGADTQSVAFQGAAGGLGLLAGLGLSAMLTRVGIPRWLWRAVEVRRVDER